MMAMFASMFRYLAFVLVFRHVGIYLNVSVDVDMKKVCFYSFFKYK